MENNDASSIVTTRQTERGMDRLRNWARWAVGGSIRMVMKHYYPSKAMVCGEYKRTSDEGDYDDPITPIDEIDAGIVEHEIRMMPAHLCHAIRYHFTGRVPVNCIIRFERIPHDQLIGLVEQAARRLG